jgi:hypothetical protein
MSCQQTPAPNSGPARRVMVSSSPTNAGDPIKPVSINEAIKSDPCALRLHDIAGAILMYYALNREMPTHLEDLRAMQDVDQQLNFTCPVSNQPYVYVPQGMTSPGRTKMILVHDPTPSHNGTRWCILAASGKPGEPISLEVLPITEPVFLSYKQ